MLIARKIKSYFIDVLHQAHRPYCVLNPYIKLLLTLVWVACLYRRYKIPLPQIQGYQPSIFIPQDLVLLPDPITSSPGFLLWPKSFPRKPLLWHSSAWHLIIHYLYFWEEWADENVRDDYDDRITWDFTTILEANVTDLFTNILKIGQVFRFGSQPSPKWQSTTFKVYW